MIRVKGKGDVDAYCLPHPPQLEHRSQSDSNRQSVLEIIALVYAIRKRIKPEGEKRYLAIVQFSRSVMSDSLRPHEPQHARPSCPSPTPRVHPNPCPLSQWYHPTVSSSVIPFSSCPQSFPASGFFQWVSSSHQVAKGLEFQLQHQSFQWTPD